MEAHDTLRRMALQRLESLQRAGMTGLKRAADTASPAGFCAPPAPPPPDAGLTRLADSPATTFEPPSRPAARTAPVSDPAPAAAITLEPDMARRKAPESREAALDVLRREVAACRRCPELACARTQTVFGVGNIHPRLCFFGEAPGADEDRRGEPFVGRAGQLLTDIIQKGMKLQRSDVYILNVLKCRPPDNRPPTDVEIANCREYFERQLEILQPEFICCLGATAVKALLQRTQPMGRLRGQWFDYRGARVIVTYHPSYLLRNPAAKKDTWQDIQLLMHEMKLPVSPRD